MSAISTRVPPIVASEPVATILHVITDDFALDVPVRLTLTQFRKWALSDAFPQSVPVHFIEGEVFLDMSNEELEAHVAVKTEIVGALRNVNKNENIGKLYGDGGLVSNLKAGVSNNPDAFLLTWKTLEVKKARLVPRKKAIDQYIEVEGSPDWALEVVSLSSVMKDTVKLRRAYHRGGVKEYWLVDARGAEIEFSILLWRKRGYVHAPANGAWQYSEVFGRWFRLIRTRDRLGTWEYTLEDKKS